MLSNFGVFVGLGLVASVSAEQLSMNQAIQIGLDQSVRMEILRQNKAASDEVVKEVGSVIYPKLEFNASAGLGQSPMGIKMGGGSSSSSGPNPAYDTLSADAKAAVKYMGQSLASSFKFDNDPRANYRIGLTASQPIYTFGKLTTAIKVAGFQDSVVKRQFARGRQEVQYMIFESYVGLVMAQRALGLLETSRKRTRETVDYLDRNFKLGHGTKGELLRAQAALIQLDAKEVELNRDLLKAQMNLNQVLGRELRTPVTADTTLPALPWLKDSLPVQEETVLEDANRRRGDVNALEMQRRIYEGGEVIDRANYLPSIYAQAKFGFTAYDSITGLYDWDNRDWSVGVALSWTLLDGGANAAKASQKRIQSNVLAQEKLNVQRQMRADIVGRIQDVQVSRANANALEKSRLALLESRDYSQRNFKSGSGSLSDLLSVDESLAQTENMQLINQWQEVRAKAALRHAQGLDLMEMKE